MNSKKRPVPSEKTSLHPRNRHRDRYDFETLIQASPELATFVRPTGFGADSIDFFNPQAVKSLNRALLKHFYGLHFWEIPDGFLCPPVPGRADYIHYVADLISSRTAPDSSSKNPVVCLDVGTGANLIYPIIGRHEYGWRFIGSEIDPVAAASAQKIVDENPVLRGNVEIRLQENPDAIFHGILKPGEQIDVTLCNPPFHASASEARAGSVRKLQNLKQKRVSNPVLNFGGRRNELWCDGGEERFVGKMILESRDFADSVGWFTTLISKETTLKPVLKALRELDVVQLKTISMHQGQKTSRFIAWTFRTTSG